VVAYELDSTNDAVAAVPSKLPVKPYNALIEPVNDRGIYQNFLLE
jgi:hypothetical protein